MDYQISSYTTQLLTDKSYLTEYLITFIEKNNERENDYKINNKKIKKQKSNTSLDRMSSWMDKENAE